MFTLEIIVICLLELQSDRLCEDPKEVIIGDNVLIAANSYVNFDVPENSIVIGNPGHIYPSVHATDGYICQKYLEK